MSQIEIFDKELLKKRYARANRDDFLVNEAALMLEECLLDIKYEFNSSLEIDRFDEMLPHGENKYDLIRSYLQLHFINDLPGVLAQANRLLKPDGFFVANMFGGDTLKELRKAFALADESSLSPRISPMLDVRDGGALLQRAGFNLPVADVEKIMVTYETPFHLMRHLRKLGETNALKKQRRNFTGKNFMAKVAAIYQDKFSDNEGRVEATYEIVTLSGWKYSAKQQTPLERGSAEASLEDSLK